MPASILLLTNAPGHPLEILPALELLAHKVHILPAEATALLDAGDTATSSWSTRARTCRLPLAVPSCCSHRAWSAPLLLVLTEGGMAAVSALWQADDVLLDTAGPAEVEARLRLAIARSRAGTEADTTEIRAAGVVIDEASYTAKVHGEPLNLTYKEFELLKYLAQHPGRVFTRDQLLHEVWGYDYYGGTRTVDVHVRRLRAKLGADHEQLIGTVRNVGYRFTLARALDDEDHRASSAPRTRPRPGARDPVATARYPWSHERMPRAPTGPSPCFQGVPDAELLRQVRALAAAAEESDGNPPLCEQTLGGCAPTTTPARCWAGLRTPRGGGHGEGARWPASPWRSAAFRRTGRAGTGGAPRRAATTGSAPAWSEALGASTDLDGLQAWAAWRARRRGPAGGALRLRAGARTVEDAPGAPSRPARARAAGGAHAARLRARPRRGRLAGGQPPQRSPTIRNRDRWAGRTWRPGWPRTGSTRPGSCWRWMRRTGSLGFHWTKIHEPAFTRRRPVRRPRGPRRGLRGRRAPRARRAPGWGAP